jgi:hypothetical protein
VCNQRKKNLAPTPHTQSIKISWQRAKGWVSIYSQGVFDPGSWHEPGPMLRKEPRATRGALVPVYATNRDRFSKINWDRAPGGINRDQCLSLVPIDKPNRDRCHFGARPKTHFLLVAVVLPVGVRQVWFLFMHSKFFLCEEDT